MPARHQPLSERLCRALCHLYGNPENTKFEGKPMWESYKDEAKLLCELIGLPAFLAEVRVAATAPGTPDANRTRLVSALAAFEDGAR